MTVDSYISHSVERTELATTLRRFLDQNADEERARSLFSTVEGYSRATWQQLAETIGVPALAVDERYGGAGFSFADLIPVFEESGRHLYTGALLGTTALATTALLLSGDESVCEELLPGIAEGATTAALAWMEEPIRWDADGIAARVDKNLTLTGVKTHVVDGMSADIVLVVARDNDGIGLYAVKSDASGLTRTAMETVDLTRKQARLQFDAVPARLIGSAGDGWRILQGTLDYAALALAAESIGAARACLDTAVEYAGVRHQFGRPIGSFQAVKHRCADMWVAVESASTVLHDAVAILEETGAPDPLATEHAYLAAVDALSICAESNIRVHGGIGFTWEHSAHLYYRRARSVQTLLGPARLHRQRLSELAGLRGRSL
ncbi:acyl-CoA dehydrogenase family protein [Rhodococcus sp. OK302]|uniref:acyl-CoA dehydrogenase family protein n=1 Tax=Rhodococcus sp. OK302 TaxID=1882769 RepID=UPI000B9428B9|nr:acyl-CoA dehydrogenase family protein [Rhodococcus sp. OK302]OYD66652.1 alkylation response protein AidB-like acyl-CoA dehydrogenase [Rhodococcus sp. OK302]